MKPKEPIKDWEKFKAIGESDEYIEYQRTRRTDTELIDDWIKIPKEFIRQERDKVKEEIYKELEELDKQANEGARKEKEELIKAGYATEGGKFDLEEFAKSIEQRTKEQVKKEIKKWLIKELEGVSTNGKCHKEIFQDFEDFIIK